ncbi:minor tail protein [Arthrobacter phage Andrew]|uniref:Minor tail protein n=1 Tax=Arthrobacter phage Andrew TaxID=2419946 RepID=A0A3G2KCU1_9CAUD|nr:minor tail protein [Arthrobacter phage Andrew]AYN56834.1 minor tail protein [Arthrobacter phage Andrew]
MLPIEPNTVEALTGSRSGDKLEIFAWYDGQLMVPDPLPVSDWSLSWDGSDSKQVQGVLELSVEDSDGSISPWLWDDPLGVGGALLMCRYSVGGTAEVINRGWYRITENSPKESWYSRVIREDGYSEPGSFVPGGHRLVMVSGGAVVPVTAEDLTVRLALDEFLAPEQPVGTSPTVVGEITRIVGDAVPLVVAAEVVDVAVPKTLTYEGPKINAVMDLAARAGASLRMGGDGELQVYVKSSVPVWTIAGGEDGALINIDRTNKAEILSNVGVVRGEAKQTDDNGQQTSVPLVGVSQVMDGPLRVGGPHGRVPRFLDSSLLTTQNQVDAAAQSLITNYLSSLTIDLEVTCLPHPALQVGDFVTVTQPLVEGQLMPITGEVVSMTLRATGSTVSNMTLTVRCNSAQVQDLRRQLRNMGG